MNNCLIDDTDLQILLALQEDGRMANKEIAARVELAPSATSERLKKLKERGVIQKIEARLNGAALDYGLVAFIHVRTDELPGVGDAGADLASIPEAQEVFNVAGEDCYLVKVRTRDTESLSVVLRDKIGAIESVTSTRTTIVMQSFKETCAIPLTDCKTKASRANRRQVPTGDSHD